MDERHQKVSHRAYELWEKEGRPHGRDQEFWERAESMEREAKKGPMTTPLQKRSKAEAKQDKALADTFPASDPPAASAATGTRKAPAAVKGGAVAKPAGGKAAGKGDVKGDVKVGAAPAAGKPRKKT